MQIECLVAHWMLIVDNHPVYFSRCSEYRSLGRRLRSGGAIVAQLHESSSRRRERRQRGHDASPCQTSLLSQVPGLYERPGRYV